MNDQEALRYPIGRFSPKETYSRDELSALIDKIESLPDNLEKEVAALSVDQLDTPYREGGWTARQVIHHLPDSHLNAYIRLKWTLTEDNPLIKAYDEKAWAETPETTLDPHISLNMLNALHAKWVRLLRRLTADDFARRFTHPETGKEVTIARQVATYAWHGEHHIGHIRIIANRKK